MKLTRLISLAAGCILFITGLVRAQQPGTGDLFHDAQGNTYHQVFFDFPIKELLEMSYTDGVPVDGELSPDGYSLIIKNYPGNKSVRVRFLNETGQQESITKSRCFIDPVLLTL
jgi:hypothetical protein